MTLRTHQLKAPRGARRPRRRLGRGIAAGQGKTAGRGTKGQLARTGPGLPGWFEGGQTPLHMRVPKLRGSGFPRARSKDRLRSPFVAVNVGQLARYAAEGKVSPETLAAKGLISPDARVKVLGEGILGAAFEVHAHAVSGTAREKIEKAGGSVVLIGAPAPAKAS